MSPRKSSTSSARPHLRPRYLGIEVAGEPLVPRGWLEGALGRALQVPREAQPAPRVRIVRAEGRWAIAEVEHTWVAEARRAWNGTIGEPGGRRAVVGTHRTWGTLKDAKVWLRARTAEPGPA